MKAYEDDLLEEANKEAQYIEAWNAAIEQAMKIISKGSHAGVNQTQWALVELEKLKK